MICWAFLNVGSHRRSAQADTLTAKWKSEREKLSKAQKLKADPDQARNELATAQRNGDYQRAGELAYGKIPDLERKLKAIEEQAAQHSIASLSRSEAQWP